MGRRNPWTDRVQILFSCRDPGRNHVYQIWWRSVKGFLVRRVPKFALSHWLWWSSLQQCYATACTVMDRYTVQSKLMLGVEVRWVRRSQSGWDKIVRLDLAALLCLWRDVIGHRTPCYWKTNKMPRHRRDDRAMPLYISIRIEFYNGIARFLCHRTAFLYSPTSAENHGTRPVKATMIVNMWLVYSAKKC